MTRASYSADDETVEVKPGEQAVVRIALKRAEAASASDRPAAAPTLAPGVLVFRSPGHDLAVTADNTRGDHGTVKLAALTGEIVVSSLDTSFSVYLRYERALNSVALALDRIPDSDVRQNGKILAPSGSQAHVSVKDGPIVDLEFGENGPHMLMQYRAARN